MSSSRTFFRCKRFKSHFIRNSSHASSPQREFLRDRPAAIPVVVSQTYALMTIMILVMINKMTMMSLVLINMMLMFMVMLMRRRMGMPGRNLSGGESHFSSFFFVAHFSWTKLDFCHRPPLSNVKGKVMQACFL